MPFEFFYCECLGSSVAVWLGPDKMVKSSNPDPGIFLPNAWEVQIKHKTQVIAS